MEYDGNDKVEKIADDKYDHGAGAKFFRLISRKTQAALAKKAGLEHQQYWSNYEGMKNIPNDIIEKMAFALGVEPVYIKKFIPPSDGSHIKLTGAHAIGIQKVDKIIQGSIEGVVKSLKVNNDTIEKFFNTSLNEIKSNTDKMLNNYDTMIKDKDAYIAKADLEIDKLRGQLDESHKLIINSIRNN